MYLVLKIFIVFLGLLWSAESRTSDRLKVRLPHGGILVGRYMTTHSGKGVRAFRGVPYAQPPVDDLRFKVNFFRFLPHVTL